MARGCEEELKGKTMTREELTLLLSKSLDARQTFEASCALNTVGQPAAERVNLDIDHRKAIRNYTAARAAYEDAIDVFINQQPGEAP